VPVRIVHLSDAEMIEAELVENLIRAEIHPMEEAEGFARLLALEEPKYSIEQISARVGKLPSFVASRLKLVDLVPAAVDAFYANEIGVSHALLLAKLPADQQEQALSACFKVVYNNVAKPARILLPIRNMSAGAKIGHRAFVCWHCHDNALRSGEIRGRVETRSVDGRWCALGSCTIVNHECLRSDTAKRNSNRGKKMQ